jgi:protein-disulfide isomerase
MTRLSQKHPLARLRAPAGFLILTLAVAGSGGGLLAQAAAPSSAPSQPLNGLDFSGLTPEQTAAATKILTDVHCNCGCTPPMTLAECRVKDPNCSRSLSLARGVIQDFKDGKGAEVAKANLQTALAKAAAAAPPPPAAAAAADPGKAYNIDITGDPFKGPKSAPVTIVEFSDYQ